MRSNRSRVFDTEFGLLVLGLTILCACTLKAADDPIETEPLSTFLAATLDQQADPQALWDALLGAGFVIDSEDPSLGGRFDLVVIGGQHPPYLRIMADANSSGAHVVMLGPRNLPYVVSAREHLLRHDPESGWRSNVGDWAFVIDEDHAREFFDQAVPHEQQGLVRLDLAGFLREVFRHDDDTTRPAGVTWIPSNRTLKLDKGNGTKGTLQFRTPNDQQLFGTALADLALTSKNGVHIRLTSFQRDPSTVLRIAPTDPRMLADKVGADDEPIEQLSFRAGPVGDKEFLRDGAAIWDQLFPVELRDPRPRSWPEEEMLGVRFREQLFTATAGWKKVLPKRSQAPDEFALLQEELGLELHIARLNTALCLASGDRVYAVDDPLMHWAGFEAAVGPAIARGLLEKVFLATVMSPETPLEVRLEMIHAFGPAGCPPWLIESGDPVQFEDHRLCNALLKSYWNVELTEEDIDACVHLCNDLRQLVRDAAVQALVQAGHLPRIPRESLNDWFERHVAAIDDHDEIVQPSLLLTLSARPAGRAYLVERVTDDDITPRLANRIASAIVYRVTAARALRRYDFLSLEEGNRLVTALNAHKDLIEAGAEPRE